MRLIKVNFYQLQNIRIASEICNLKRVITFIFLVAGRVVEKAVAISTGIYFRKKKPTQKYLIINLKIQTIPNICIR